MAQTFETSDLGLASLLYAEGVKFHGARSTDQAWRKVMVFDQPPEDLLRAWQSGSANVNALSFWRASRILKKILKSEA
jgi:hypothetical protein